MSKSLKSILESYIKKTEGINEKRYELAVKEAASVALECKAYNELCQEFEEFKINNPEIPVPDIKIKKETGNSWRSKDSKFNFTKKVEKSKEDV